MGKRCKVCGEVKALDDFYRSSGMRDGHRNDCKACNLAAKRERTRANPEANRARVRRWQEANPERYRELVRRNKQTPAGRRRERNGHLKRKYGITVEEYDSMLSAQGGRCAICRREPHPTISLHVDHDHALGHLRGLTCFDCNAGLGKFRDSRELLVAAMTYLDLHDPDTQAMAELARRRARSLRPAG
jgi:hypothetical protein